MKCHQAIFYRSILVLKHNKYYSSKPNSIYALSSGYGKCGVAVVRVSGPQSMTALKALTKLHVPPQPRVALLRKIYCPITNDVLDRGLVLWFPGPNSFTGEDCCEFQLHGSVAVVSAVLKSLSTIEFLRPAEPGEFTKRAFYFGKLDLTEVEGLADLLQAETELQRKQAYLQMEGGLSRQYNEWRNILIKSLANIEAHIDFEETESLDDNLSREISCNIQNLHKSIFKHLIDGRKGEILRNGVKAVIIGEPNVGKSSLFNMLSQKPAAIVTPIEGTTRDLLEITLDINGYPLILTDTAGLRKNTSDVIEKEGINRAISSIETADLIIFVIDATKFIKCEQKGSISKYLKQYIENMGLDNSYCLKKEHIIVLNKSDLIHNSENNDLKNDANTVLISCKTEHGISDFIDEITNNLQKLCGTPSKEHPSINQERHRTLLMSCAKYLQNFIEKSDSDHADVVLMAQDLRLALRQLGKLSGQVTTEDLLDVIFKEFCIGK